MCDKNLIMLTESSDAQGGHGTGDSIEGYTGNDAPPLTDPGETLPF